MFFARPKKHVTDTHRPLQSTLSLLGACWKKSAKKGRFESRLGLLLFIQLLVEFCYQNIFVLYICIMCIMCVSQSISHVNYECHVKWICIIRTMACTLYVLCLCAPLLLSSCFHCIFFCNNMHINIIAAKLLIQSGLYDWAVVLCIFSMQTVCCCE